MAVDRLLKGQITAKAPYSWQTPTMKSPYVSRAINCQGANSEFVKLVGGTVAWGQMLAESNEGTFTPKFDLTYTGITGKFGFHVTGTYNYSSGDRNVYFYSGSPNIPITNGHVYFVSNTSKYAGIYLFGASFTGYSLNVNPYGGVIARATSSANLNMSLHFGSNIANGTVFDEDVYVCIHDLTSLFGPAIADYAYSLEQQSAGSGIAWLKSYGFFTEDYYPYATSKLESVQTSAHVIKDADGNVIGTYPTSDVILRGITELVGNEIRYNGDTYEADGTVTRRFAEVDLGDIAWAYNSTYDVFVNNGFTTADNAMWKNTLYPCVGVYTQMSDKTCGYIFTSRMCIRDSDFNGDANAFKTAMSGVKAIYEVRTPTTESADPFSNPITIDPNGSESWTDAGTRDFEMPVGNESSYAGLYPDLNMSPLGLKAQLTLVDPFA